LEAYFISGNKILIGQQIQNNVDTIQALKYEIVPCADGKKHIY